MSGGDPVAEWFSRRRLGLFLHFGLYAVDGWHEQDQMRRRIPRKAYETRIRRFNPRRFDPDRILDLAERAGMEYVCLTAKHHDGFCLWDTRETPFQAMRSPCRRDLVRELADACRRRKIPLGLYYSVADWHHPNYPNEGRHHELAGPEPGDRPDWGRYMEFLTRQVRELCSNYGEIRHFFWDMNVPQHRDPAVNAMLRELQPRMVINDRGFDEGDFGTPEREYQDAEIARIARFGRPTEACHSVGSQSWGFRKDEDYHTPEHLIGSLDGMMARGAHFLLNVGPDADGNLPGEAVRTLREIGAWYRRAREAFSDTEPASDLALHRGVLLTRRGRTLYAHVRTPAPTGAVCLAPIPDLPVRAVLLNTGEELPCSNDPLPAYWKSGAPVLRVRGLPRRLLAGGPTPVIRLDFAAPPRQHPSAAEAFRG